MAETRILNDRYELRSRLGEGGMASVFLADDRLLERRVAVKVLTERYAKDGSFVERFRREARAAAGLSHRNVVSVYDTGSADGVHYIVMEYVEGRTLASAIAEEGPMAPARAARIAASIARGLAAAHERGLVHRDVKPGNVLLTADGEVKVMDFGIARATTGEPITETGTLLGTAAYVSPEQARGKPVDARSDIYSLGCVVYEMLTGRPPFSGDSAVAIAHRHVSEKPAHPRSLNPGIPAALEATTMRALAKDPDARHRSAGKLAEELDRAANVDVATEPLGEPTEVLPVTRSDVTAPLPVAAPGPKGPRAPWLAWALGAGAAAVVGLVVALAVLADGKQPSTPAAPRPATTAPSPPPSPSPTPPPSINAALSALELTLQRAADDGGIDGEAVQEIVGRVEEALAALAAGDQAGALERLAEIQSQVAELANEGGISAEWADPIIRAIDNLAVAIQAVPPPTVAPPEEVDDEPGRGRGKGKGNKGKGGGKDE